MKIITEEEIQEMNEVMTQIGELVITENT